MTQDQTNAIENLMRASARLKTARKELAEAQRDHSTALQKAKKLTPEIFYVTSSADMDEDDD